MMSTRRNILRLVENIQCIDSLERSHQQDVLDWIRSGAEIFRIEKPDKPVKHLVAYFVLVDIENSSILLVDHIKADRWLPTGGHVEKDEDPKSAVQRESLEEIGIGAEFILDVPFFVTVTTTVGKTAGHTDVSLWYILRGDVERPMQYDLSEFRGCHWFKIDEILDMDITMIDPHMHRFIQKLKSYLEKTKLILSD